MLNGIHLVFRRPRQTFTDSKRERQWNIFSSAQHERQVNIYRSGQVVYDQQLAAESAFIFALEDVDFINMDPVISLLNAPDSLTLHNVRSVDVEHADIIANASNTEVGCTGGSAFVVTVLRGTDGTDQPSVTGNCLIDEIDIETLGLDFIDIIEAIDEWCNNNVSTMGKLFRWFIIALLIFGGVVIAVVFIALLVYLAKNLMKYFANNKWYKATHPKLKTF